MKKFVLFFVVAILIFMSAVPAFAWGGHGGGGNHYYNRGGRWYRSGYFWGGAAVTALAVGAMIASIPPKVQPVNVNGVIYYTDGTYYYQPTVDGRYVVVAPPVVVQTVQIVPVQQPQVVYVQQPAQQPVVVQQVPVPAPAPKK